jgi:hypothetical protein
MKKFLGVLACLAGLIAATAAATTGERFWEVTRRPGDAQSNFFQVDWSITAACGSVVAGLIVAAFVTGRLARPLLAVLGVVSLAMLATSEYLHHQAATRPRFVVTDTAGLPLQLFDRVLVPSPAFALLAVALIWLAVSRRPVATFAGFPAATVEPRRPVAGGLLALLLGVLVWVSLGLAVVAFATAKGQAILDWTGALVVPATVSFGSVTVLYLVGAAGLVVGGGLYAALLSRRLHPSEPLVIGVVYAAAVVAAVVNTVLAQPRGLALPSSALLSALVLGVQAMTAGPGALLAVPLIAVGVTRLRNDQPASVATTYAAPSNDPTIPLY